MGAGPLRLRSTKFKSNPRCASLSQSLCLGGYEELKGAARNSPQSAERDVAASAANQAVWMLRCQNASYRVTLIPNLAAQDRNRLWAPKRCRC